eukprot:2974802-Alexandrium_andersonii.AAC.1
MPDSLATVGRRNPSAAAAAATACTRTAVMWPVPWSCKRSLAKFDSGAEPLPASSAWAALCLQPR